MLNEIYSMQIFAAYTGLIYRKVRKNEAIEWIWIISLLDTSIIALLDEQNYIGWNYEYYIKWRIPSLFATYVF